MLYNCDNKAQGHIRVCPCRRMIENKGKEVIEIEKVGAFE